MKKVLCLSLLLILCFPSLAFSHSGSTDANGGHYDHSTGEYHYHHGYSAHIHYHNICPYDVAEIAYDTSYPWEFEPFLDEYVDGFNLGYDIGAWIGDKDGYNEYHKNTELFNPWTDYDDSDHPQESPYAYGYCDGYRFGYCIEFEEAYNYEALYDDKYFEKYYDPEIEEVHRYIRHETAFTPSIKTENDDLEHDSTDIIISSSVENNSISDSDNILLHKIKAFFTKPANDIGDSKATLLFLSLFCLFVGLLIIGGLIGLIGSFSSSNKIENVGKKISSIGLYGVSTPIWIMMFVPMFILTIPSFVKDLFLKKKKK